MADPAQTSSTGSCAGQPKQKVIRDDDPESNLMTVDPDRFQRLEARVDALCKMESKMDLMMAMLVNRLPTQPGAAATAPPTINSTPTWTTSHGATVLRGVETTPTTWHGAQVPMTPMSKTRLSPPRPNMETRINFQVKEPDTYDGRRSPDAWIFSMDNYLQLKQAPDDGHTLTFVTSFLREDVLLWWRRHCIEHPVDHPARINSWTNFKVALEANFRPVNQESRARDRLAELRQRGSARSYTHEFRQLAMEIPNMPTLELQDKYVRGLKPQVRVEVEKSQALGLCQTLEQVIAMAEKMDCIMTTPREDQSQAIPPGRRRYGGRPWSIRNPLVNLIPPKPFDPTKPQPPRMLPVRANLELRDQLRAENKCFYCKEMGHIAANCPKKPKVQVNQTEVPDEDPMAPDQQGNDNPQ